MKTQFLIAFGISSLLMACSSGTNNEGNNTDSIPDSVPHAVRLGKEASWAFMPDTMMNEILIGDEMRFKKYMYDNGSKGVESGENKSFHYFNAYETEFLTVFSTKVGKDYVPTGIRLEKNSDTLRTYKLEHNYCVDGHFISGHGVYIGMSPEFVQSIYKSQSMMQWTKGDTTYLEYKPEPKDKQHYKRYKHTDYYALYKFVDEQCKVFEMIVDPKAFASQ